MKLSSWVLVVFSVATVASCFQPPDYPVSPEIEFEDVYYGDGQSGDSIVVTFKFKDGDGDIGLGSAQSETFPPFHERWYYASAPLDLEACRNTRRCFYLPNPGTNPVEFAKFIKYKAKRTGQPVADTLEAFVNPYACSRWEVIKGANSLTLDTVYYRPNEHHNNIFIEFQVKNGNDWVAYDEGGLLNYPECRALAFNSRIPILMRGEPGSPLEGRISYSIKTFADYKILFGSNLLRLKISIEDRALHRSNEIFTREFNLTGG